LANWLARARRGGRAICFLAGEPGAGKTTLVDHFLSNIADRNAIWIARGQCVPNYGVHETYGPLFDAIEHLALDPARCDFVQLIRQHAPTWLAQLPSVFHAREVSEKREELTGSGPGRMLRELTDMTHLAPGIIVLEDLHWSDSATLGWICAWALRRAPAPLMIFGTYRSDEADCNVARIAPVLGDCERRRPAVFGGRARFRSGRRWSGLANLFSSGASDLFAFAPQSHIPDTGNAAPEHFSLPIMASLAYTSGAQLTNWSVLPSFSGLSSGGPVDSHSAVYIEQSLLVC
jgi:hypothetical protein